MCERVLEVIFFVSSIFFSACVLNHEKERDRKRSWASKHRSWAVRPRVLQDQHRSTLDMPDIFARRSWLNHRVCDKSQRRYATFTRRRITCEDYLIEHANSIGGLNIESFFYRWQVNGIHFQQSANQMKLFKVLPDLKPCAVRWPVFRLYWRICTVTRVSRSTTLFFILFIIRNENSKFGQNPETDEIIHSFEWIIQSCP